MGVPVLSAITVTLAGIEGADPYSGYAVTWDIRSLPGMFDEGDWRLRIKHLSKMVEVVNATGEAFKVMVPFSIKHPVNAATTTLATDATVARTATLPDKTGKVAFLDDIPPDYISGMQIRTTATTIEVSAGTFMSDDGNLVKHPGGTITSSRGSNTLYHVYATANGNLVRLTAAPPAPYYGSARGYGSGEGRWIGCVRTNDGTVANNYIQQQTDWGNNQVRVTFLQNTGSAPLVLATASSLTGIQDASGAAITYGPTCNFFTVRIMNGAGSSAVLRYYAWTGAAFVTFSNLPNPATLIVCDVPVDDTPKMQWDNASAGGSATINLLGYGYSR